MDKYILEYNNSIPEVLCEDIIEKYEESNDKITKNVEIKGSIKNDLLGTISTSVMVIPKDNKDWKRIELYLYKELLSKINDYKKEIISLGDNSNLTTKLLLELSEDMYLKDFHIQKINLYGGFSEPLCGIEKPRSFIDVTERSSVKSTNDEDERSVKPSGTEKIILKEGYNRVYNRYNILNYIFYINDVDDGGEIFFNEKKVIKAKKCKLVLIPENSDYRYKSVIPYSNEQYIIFGQLYNKTNVTESDKANESKTKFGERNPDEFDSY